MRLMGYCTGCLRFRYVSVSSHQLALAAARATVIQGVCSDCEQPPPDHRRDPRGAHQGGKHV